MKVFPRLTRFLNKHGYFTRQQALNMARDFAAANVGRLTASWTTQSQSPDSETRMSLKTLVARSRNLRNENPHARKFIGMAKSNVLGECGIHFRSKVKDPDRVVNGELAPGKPDVFANKMIEDARYDWCRRGNCTTDGQLSMRGLEGVALESGIVDGEAIFRIIRGFDNKHRFALETVASDRLDVDCNLVSTRGNQVRMGVEIDQWRRPVYYWLRKNDPNDFYYVNTPADMWEQVPTRDIIHLFVKKKPNQTRGVPWMVTAMKSLNMLGGYSEAELVAARFEASRLDYFKQTGDAEYVGDTDTDGNKLSNAEPGSREILPSGLERQSNDPVRPNSNYGEFVKSVLREVAAGLEFVSYNTLANDMESVNFASGKLGLDEERQGWKVVQNWFIEEFHQRVFEAWLEMQLTTGLIPLPLTKFDKFNSAEWTGRRWDQVNPQQEMAAMTMRLKLRLTSISRELAKMGIDRDELFEEIEQDKLSAESKDITPVDIFPPEEEPADENGNPVAKAAA